MRPNITLNHSSIPCSDTFRLLGVTFDKGMTFRQHTDTINTSAKSRLNVLRSLASTTYGHSKKDITTVYKQYIRPILTYAHTSWQPDIAKSHLQKLQTTQNSALRIATGCTSGTPITHLHDETRVLPLTSHMDMRGTQIYTSTADPQHPLHYMQQPKQTPRHIHNTPANHYHSILSTIPTPPQDKSVKRHIHTTLTARALESRNPNNILLAHPPPTNPEELLLPREDQVHLSRLRCGQHPALPSYMHRIGRALSDTCTWCDQAVGSVGHVFLHCTPLQQYRNTHDIHMLEHLWTRPVAAINFLRDAGIV